MISCSPNRRPRVPRRRAFLMADMLAALGLMAFVLILVAQVVVWSLAERARFVARHAALEWANNVLELARAEPYESLGPNWARRVQPPEEPHPFPAELAVAVQVDESPGIKRVTVEIRWPSNPFAPPEVVQLIGAFAPRLHASTEEAP